MGETQQFIVMVETPQSRDEILDTLLTSFAEMTRRKDNSCDLRQNWIEIWENEDASPELITQTDTGYLHYRWRIEATPMSPQVKEPEQIQLAKEIKACLEAHGCLCVVCANFEHLV